MKLLRNLMDSIKVPFEKGGKLEKFYPVYDGIETLLFVPGHTTHKGSHIRDGIDLKRTMVTVILAMVPALLFGMWNTGYQHFLALGMTDVTFTDQFLFGLAKVLPIVVVSYAVGLGVEFTFCVIKGHAIQEGYLVSGMLIPLCLPVDIPLWMVAVASIFAVVIGKEVFGGTGMNILNVALTARAFLFFAYPTKMSGDKVWINTSGGEVVDGFSGATPLAQAYEGGVKAIPSFMDSFMGFIPGSIGETSTLAILIGAGVLILSGIGSWRIILSVFAGGYVMGLLFNLWGANDFMQVPATTQLVMGGFAFGAVFMATDPVTGTQTGVGKYIYGFLIGLFAIMIRVFNPAYPEGMMLAILFMNVMAPLIDHYVIQANINKRLKRAQTVALKS
ncbi:MAG: NADH:ubiquinone reductase (Na(+)-transporting) subunit B [Vicingaceae bacterium]